MCCSRQWWCRCVCVFVCVSEHRLPLFTFQYRYFSEWILEKYDQVERTQWAIIRQAFKTSITTSHEAVRCLYADMGAFCTFTDVERKEAFTELMRKNVGWFLVSFWLGGSIDFARDILPPITFGVAEFLCLQIHWSNTTCCLIIATHLIHTLTHPHTHTHATISLPQQGLSH